MDTSLSGSPSWKSDNHRTWWGRNENPKGRRVRNLNVWALFHLPQPQHTQHSTAQRVRGKALAMGKRRGTSSWSLWEARSSCSGSYSGGANCISKDRGPQWLREAAKKDTGDTARASMHTCDHAMLHTPLPAAMIHNFPKDLFLFLVGLEWGGRGSAEVSSHPSRGSC